LASTDAKSPPEAETPGLTFVVSPVIRAPRVRRYGAVSMTLHWIIAGLILTQIGLGWYMNNYLPDHSPAQAAIEKLHISLGLTTLLFIVARIAVRITHRAPAMPAGLGLWERLLARFSHLLFYALMLALPLTGWAMVSARPGEIGFWGLAWPHLPGVAFLTAPDQRPMRHLLQQTHTSLLVWIALANIALHVVGALKHQFDGNPVLWRMLPFGRPKTPQAAVGG
jgi:cytochrome b561